jgi:hypothetical protein
MSRALSVFAILFLSLFVFVEVAQAGLIRGGGRPTLSLEFTSNAFFMYDKDNTEITFDGRRIVGISEDSFAKRFSLGSRAYINGSNNPISAFPGGSECETEFQETVLRQNHEIVDRLGYIESTTAFDQGISQSEFDSILFEFNEANDYITRSITIDPCIWEFGFQETISMTGLFQLVFKDNAGVINPDINYRVTWLIDGNHEVGDIDLSTGAISLNKDIALAGGRDYRISASVEVSSDKGNFYLEAPEKAESPKDFELLTGEDINDESAFVNVSETNFNAIKVFEWQTVFTTEFETLRILADSSEPVVPVTAPASFGTMLLGLLILGLKRRVQILSKLGSK